MSQLTDAALKINGASDYFKFHGFKYSKDPAVYMIRNIQNFKVYIGSTVNFKKRVCSHIHRLFKNKHHSPHLQNAFNQYGINSFYFIRLTWPSIDDLKDVEQYFIDKYKSYDNIFGYNTQPSSRSPAGQKLSETTKKKIGDHFRGKPKTAESKYKNSISNTGINNHNYGKPICDNLKKAISEANIKRRGSYTFISPSGDNVNFIGLQKFCNQNNLLTGAMCSVARGKVAHHRGWRHSNSLHLKPKGHKKWRPIQLEQK